MIFFTFFYFCIMNETNHIIWNPNPILLETNGITLGYYGLMLFLSIIVSYYIVRRNFIKENIESDKVDILFILTLFFGFVFARLFHCFFYDFEYFSNHILQVFFPVKRINGELIYVGYRGIASHGGAVGLIFGALIFSRLYKIKLLNVLDKLAIVAPLMASLIRIGNFFNSEILGTETTAITGIIFARIDNIVRHPVQLYESILCLAVFFILLYLYKKRDCCSNSKYGYITAMSLILINSARFFTEFFKEDISNFDVFLPISMGQALSIPFIILGLIILFNNRTFK